MEIAKSLKDASKLTRGNQNPLSGPAKIFQLGLILAKHI